VVDAGAARPPEPLKPDEPPRGRREPAGDSVWFRMNVGRSGNADPRWLVPLICRRGHVTKSEIGAIRIFDRETKFEIASHAAARFASAVRRASGEEDEIRIEGIRPHRTGGGPPRSPGGNEPYRRRPAGGKHPGRKHAGDRS
jgi:ATP-dependent RNA helicase DeaD